MADPDDRLLVMRDIMDMQLETSDGREIGRVADVAAVWRDDGTLALTALITGPQALLARIVEPLPRFTQFLFGERFEHRIPLSDAEDFAPTIHLRGKAMDYPTGQSERWIADHILRWIPGSGRSWQQ